MPQLKMLRGPDPSEIFELDKPVITIGRGRKNDIIIQDNEVSRTHCRLVRVLDDYEIHDLESTNGTFVNGQKIDEGGWLLSGRCIVEMGDSITLEYLPTDVSTGTSPPMPPVRSGANEKVYYLIIEQESMDQPEIYVLDRMTITIGRDVDNDITLEEPEVSRHHMRLILNAEGYAIEDLNTMNGTMVNRDVVTQQHALTANDLISIGTSVHMWYTDDPDSLMTTLAETKTATLDDQVEMGKGAADSEADKEQIDDMLDSTDVKIQTGHGLEAGDLEKSLFLVYARDEWTVIGSHIYSYLDDNKVKIFTEQYLTPNTEDWDAAIEQALAESPCLLAIISEKSVEVPHVIRSIRHFLAREKTVLLLRYGKIDKLPLIIRNMPAIPFNPRTPNKTFRMILAELRRVGFGAMGNLKD